MHVTRRRCLADRVPLALEDRIAWPVYGIATTHELRYGVGGLANKPVVSELILFTDRAALWGMPGEDRLGF
jgi:hypothetical protein